MIARTSPRLPLPATLAASRAVVWGAALATLGAFGANPSTTASLDLPSLTRPFSPAVNFLLAPAVRYDAVWYLSIAHAGYLSRPATAFFPLLPALLAAGGRVTGSPLLAGLVVSLGAMAAAMWAVFELTRLELGRPAARTTVLLLAFFPSALFLSAVYTESLFLALAAGALLAARRERWATAAVLGALATATRSTGILLWPALWLAYLYGPRAGGRLRSPRRSRPGLLARWRPAFRLQASAAWLALVPAGLITYLAYLGLSRGSPLSPFGVEQVWGRSFAGPFGAAWHGLQAVPSAFAHLLGGGQTPFGPGAPLAWDAYRLIDLPFLAFALAGLWLCRRRLPASLTVFALLTVAEALSFPTRVEPMESLSRYLLAAFPLFMGWGALLAERPRLRRLALAASATGLAVLSGLWGIWAWVA